MTAVVRPSSIEIQPTALDLLRLPLLGSFLRWRWGRLAAQLVLLLVTALIVYDGLTGPQLAPRNLATVLAWVHYRGLVLLALLLVGNLFCFACPFTLPRTLARRLSIDGRRWPRALRNKWVSIGGLLLIFFLYEWLDLWASPWLTAWVALAYFVGSFALEAVFKESAFCKYVCPLGAFNFVYSTASPFQITARDQAVCRSCPGKECLNGSDQVLGCGTELFVPTIDSNMDCTFCLDCARACPYDNVALARRPAWQELVAKLPARWDLIFLLTTMAFFGFFNAFGMVPPVYALQRWMTTSVGIQSVALQVGLIYAAGAIVLPGLLLTLTAVLSRRARPPERRGTLVQQAARFAPAFVPLGAGIWLAHYGFHFIIGAATLVPVAQSFLIDHGLTWLGGRANWTVGFLVPVDLILPLQVGALMLGLLAALAVVARQGLASGDRPLSALLQLLPWALVLTGLTIASLAVFNLPMEMRGALAAVP
jgi:polyferredoxin